VVDTSKVARADRLDDDLDAIVLCALRKEPDARYHSVEEFSEDIRRYLEGMPVAAHEGVFAYHALKFVSRHKLAVTAGSMIVVLLMAGIMASLQQAKLANQQRARAERHFETVRNLAEVSMFQMHDAIEDLPGSTAARELLVKTSLEYLNALSGEAGKDPGLQHDLAAAYAKVADIQGKASSANIGQPSAAVESYAKAIALLEPLVAADPANTGQRSTLATSYLQQSRLVLLLGEPKKAAGLSQKAMAMLESVAKAAPDASTRAAWANACRVHGENLSAVSPGKEAIGFAYQAIEILEELHRKNPSDLGMHYELGMAYDTAGGVVQQGDTGPEAARTAIDLHEKAIAVDEYLVSQTGGRNAKYIRSLLADRVNVCSQYYDMGEYSRAVDMCRAARPLVATLRTDENNAQTAVDAASLEWNLGASLLGAGQLAEAEKTFVENISALEVIAKERDTLQVKYLLASCEQGVGTIHARRASASGVGTGERLRRWQLARKWYAQSVPRFEDISKSLTLTYPDRIPMDSAIAGLARSNSEIEKLER
jgi:tetratricopeptide (TPR) repeat protein